MFRKDLIPLLLENPMTVRDIARVTGEAPGDIVSDLEHLLKSLKHTEYEAVVTPARCRKCGFQFGLEKMSKPSKCPECHGTWLIEPRVAVEQRRE